MTDPLWKKGRDGMRTSFDGTRGSGTIDDVQQSDGGTFRSIYRQGTKRENQGVLAHRRKSRKSTLHLPDGVVYIAICNGFRNKPSAR